MTCLIKLARAKTIERKAKQKAVNQVLKLGAEVNMKDKYGRTALWYASEEKDHIVVVRLLLKAGADPGIKDISGQSPLTVAKARGNYMIEYVLGEGVPGPVKDNNTKNKKEE